MSGQRGGVGGTGGALARSFARDPSVKGRKLSPGIWRRIGRTATPYRRMLLVFLVLIIVDSLVSAANPLIYRAIIDDGILGRDGGLVAELAILLAGLAVADAVLSLIQRWISARIGEGLIFDLRTQVFGHVMG